MNGYIENAQIIVILKAKVTSKDEILMSLKSMGVQALISVGTDFRIRISPQEFKTRTYLTK